MNLQDIFFMPPQSQSSTQEATSGNASVLFEEGVLLHFGGRGVEQDLSKAMLHYRKAADLGHVEALFNLGLLIQNGGDGVKQNPKEAVSLYRRAAERGHSGAMCNLGLLLQNGGEGVERDLGEAMALYRRAFEDGNADAMYNLAKLRQFGEEGVQRDLVEAMALYRKAIDRGQHAGAMRNLGLLIEIGGTEVQPDRSEAMSLYWKAIEHGDLHAVFNLSFLAKKHGISAEGDWGRVKLLYRKAIEQENVSAFCSLGYLLLLACEKGVDIDWKEAISLYRKAIKRGNVDAMFGLAALLHGGAQGLKPDLAEAMSLYRKACKCGHDLAMMHLGMLLLHGEEGVEPDFQEGMAWLRASTKHGNAVAMKYLAELLVDGRRGIKRDVPEALRLFARAIHLGESWPLDGMGWSLRFGNTEKQMMPKRFCLAIDRDATVGDVEHIWGSFQRGLDGDKELEVLTKFESPIPNCVIGILIAHVHRTRKASRGSGTYHAVAARKFGEDALVIRMQNGSRVLLRFRGADKKLLWNFRGSEPFVLAKEFLRSIEGEEEVDSSSSFTNIAHKHLIALDCSAWQAGCGKAQSVRIELSQEWLSDSTQTSPSNSGDSVSLLSLFDNLSCEVCLRSWSWTDVQRSLWSVSKDSRGESAAPKHVLPRAQFDVFISHAGPDKLTVAEPIYETLARHNMNAFLDCKHLQILDTTAGEEMERAMQQARIGVFILSPEFAAREWTMKELRCFLDRDKACIQNGRPRPVLLPIFHRLNLRECSHCDSWVYGESSKHRDLLREEKFFDAERQKLCSTEEAIQALKGLREHAGVERERRGGGENLSTAAIVSEAVKRILNSGYVRTQRGETPG